jgi:serine/threonine protein phosphatase PrpC
VLRDGTTRPLSPDEETAPGFDLAHLAFGQATDVGTVRKNNQDAALSFLSTSTSSDDRPDMGVFVVADGMGGHHDGEIASAIAARTVITELVRRVYVPLLSGEGDTAPITEALTEAIERANDAVVRSVPEGGTTCTAAVILGDLAYVGHVGDSRAYLIHSGKIEQITRDHSYVQRLYELGQLEDAANHPIKNVLYRALGQGESLEVDVYTKRLPAMSFLLLCSDGLWGQVRDQDILDIIARHSNAQAACAELIMAANQAGGVDNVSAILVQIPR